MNEEKKDCIIIVNGSEITVQKTVLTYEEIVHYAFAEIPSGASPAITVVFRKGEDKKPEGFLVKGDSVKAKNGMIFDVTATNKS